MDATTAWFWEGNVVEALARYLTDEGWTIVSRANTHTKERGVDIHASKGSAILLVEAKGYPSKDYRDPSRAGEKKKTSPTLQAQHWYSHALLKTLRLQTQHPAAAVAMAFPDFTRYRTLYEETRLGLEKLGVTLFGVKEDGSVEDWSAAGAGHG
jgi:hypothetical protein